MDSTSLEGRIGTFLEKEARTLPWLSRTITPRLDSFVSLNVAPSKLTFKLGAGGGLHHSFQNRTGPGGKLTWPPDSQKPIIHYTPGDSISLTIAESDANFDNLSGDHVTEARNFCHLIPHLETSDSKASILTLQVTLFSNKGFCLGVVANHAVLDGKAMSLFLDSWAYISKLDNGLLATNSRSLEPHNFEDPTEDIVRGTFELSRADIEKLRKRVFSWGDKVGDEAKTKTVEPFQLSTFVLTFAYIMVCVAKAKELESNKLICLYIPANYRSRLDPPVPTNYFGNCAGAGGIVAQARELMEETGLAIAAYRIIDGIKKIEGFLDEAEKWIKLATGQMGAEGTQTLPEMITVAWSNKFKDYERDFGWGRPQKVALTNIHRTRATTIAESKNGNGGVEVGVVLKKHEMDLFASLFVTGLQSL
ncbi:malonyl-CoA:anthocyanidin 5-O-glucoside-6''-O-malonyltransferase-like [Quercus robur]|uniref:malonyl-CoA:anthocyanidin 5-O-glucoside-6''-O-malonyltransferase-like n=1 Tax=Quercus robur TaxID=38942 RepID=UPI0021616AE7|nr:malonyl-CoA:anthocyanidin 5-O-glucoside-6''-O-malonyltransferase-like [Quercus robur]